MIIKSPASTTFFGSVGKDEYGDSLAEMLQEDGIDVCFQYQESEATGTDVCIITGTKKYVWVLVGLLIVFSAGCQSFTMCDSNVNASRP